MHEIVENIGTSRATMALPSFHALTGCDTTASFFNKGKKLAWGVGGGGRWIKYPVITRVLMIMSHPHLHLETNMPYINIINTFVSRLYSVQDDQMPVDDARLQRRLHKARIVKQMPLSSDALQQRSLRTAHQACIKFFHSLMASFSVCYIINMHSTFLIYFVFFL